MSRKTIYAMVCVLLCAAGLTTFLKADEPVKTGEKRDTLLYIRTDPPGAKVLINGKEVGTSDGLFRVEPGSGTLLVELEGRKPDKRQVIIRANSITRVELSLDPKTEPKAELEAEIKSEPKVGPRAKDRVPPLVAHLPQGTVELVGITEFPPTEQSRWWKPDGSDADPGGPFLAKPTGQKFSPDEKPRAFLLRKRDLPEDASCLFWGIDPASVCSITRVLDARGEVVPDYDMVWGKLGAADAASIRLSFDTGPWQTVASQKADDLGTSRFDQDGASWTVTLQSTTAGLPEAAQVYVIEDTESHSEWKSRLVAVDADGAEHASPIHNQKGAGKAVFSDLPLASIKEFRFQLRPYYRVEFKNLPLRRAQKTDPKAVTSVNDQGRQYVAQLPQGSVELIGVTHYPPTEQSKWWKPDGSPVELGTFLPRAPHEPPFPRKRSVALLIRLKNLPPGTSWPAWKISPSVDWWEGNAVVNAQGETMEGYKLFCPDFDKSVGTANFRVGIDMGPWETVIVQKPGRLGPSTFSRGDYESTVTFLKAEARDRATEASTRVTLTSNEPDGEWKKRLVAVTGDGIEHAAEPGYMEHNGEAFFQGLQPSSIQEFRYQVRPFEWVEFKNVSLQPGEKTEVVVVSAGKAAESDGPDPDAAPPSSVQEHRITPREEN